MIQKTDTEKKQLDFQAEKIIGLDIEREDREVGIFGNIFMLGIETENNKVWIDFDDENFMSLLELLKPYVLNEIAREEFDKEMYEDYLRENDNTTKQKD